MSDRRKGPSRPPRFPWLRISGNCSPFLALGLIVASVYLAELLLMRSIPRVQALVPAWLLDHVDAAGMALIVTPLAAWALYRIRPPHQADNADRHESSSPRLQGIGSTLLVFACITGCVWLAQAVAKHVVKETLEEELTTVARLAAVQMDARAHSALTDSAQQNGTDYARVVAPLKAMLRVTPSLRYAYTLRRSPEGPRFVVDAAEPVDSDNDGVIDQSELGELYDEEDAAMQECLDAGRITVNSEPAGDKWGSFVSAFAPVFHPDGRLECIVGIDTTAEQYLLRLDRINLAALAAMGMGLVVSIGCGLTLYVSQRRRQQADRAMRESESRFRTLVECADVIVWECDPENDRFTYVSPQAVRLGYPLEDWLRPGFWVSCLHPDDREKTLAYCTGEIEAGRHHRYQYRMIAADGRVLWIEDFVHVERGANQKVILRGVLVDITDQKQSEQDLAAARTAAESASRTKSEFLANMSHEIRTPMTAIIGFADLLLDPSTDKASHPEHIATIKRNGDHLLTLINDILDLSKVEAGKLEIESQPVRLDQIIADVQSMMQVRAQAKGLSLQATCDAPVPRRVRTDALRLRQILVNLVGNAIKFTQRGRVAIALGYRDGKLRIRVQDSGIGMSQETINRLFGAFQQADASTTRKFGGTGLGLHLSRRLAQMLGGDIAVYSEVGRGSHFTVTLHAEAVDVEDTFESFAEHRPSVNALPLQRDARRALEGVTVWVVEDGADNLRLIQFHLQRAGAQVRGFANGRLAMNAMTLDGGIEGDLISPPACDLIITDMQMPEMDGYTLARLLRKKGWTRPIIALTANAMSGDAEKCLEAGCDAYASKPLDVPALLKICASQSARIARAA